MGFLSTALFGPKRQTYLRRRLTDSQVQPSAAPAIDSLHELRAEVADLDRRIERQVANLEGDDTTPALRRRIAARVADLEQWAEDRRERVTVLAKRAADAPPTAADMARALERLPLFPERLGDLPQPELRALFDSLQLQIAFQPAAGALDVEMTLVADESPDPDEEMSQVWSVPPGGVGPDLRRLMRLRQRLFLRRKVRCPAPTPRRMPFLPPTPRCP